MRGKAPEGCQASNARPTALINSAPIAQSSIERGAPGRPVEAARLACATGRRRRPPLTCRASARLDCPLLPAPLPLQFVLLACLALAAAADDPLCVSKAADGATAAGKLVAADDLPYSVEYTSTADPATTTYHFKVGAGRCNLLEQSEAAAAAAAVLPLGVARP